MKGVDLGKLRGIMSKAYIRNSMYFGLRATIAMLFINENAKYGSLTKDTTGLYHYTKDLSRSKILLNHLYHKGQLSIA